MTTTEPLRREHRELLPRDELLRAAAEALGGDDRAALAGIHEGVLFLREQLIPHAPAEDTVLYTEVERVRGAVGATATMRREHIGVEGVTAELERIRGEIGAGGMDVEQRRRLRHLLYALYALVSLHFAKEEEIYLPGLDSALASDEAAAMFARMEKAVLRARGGRAAIRPVSASEDSSAATNGKRTGDGRVA